VTPQSRANVSWLRLRNRVVSAVVTVRAKLEGRQVAVGALVGLTVVGGSAGALAGADPRPYAQNASVSIVVAPGATANGSQVSQARLLYIARFARRSDTFAAAGRATGFSGPALAERTTVQFSGPGGLLVRAHESTLTVAQAMASRLANQTVLAAQRAVHQNEQALPRGLSRRAELRAIKRGEYATITAPVPAGVSGRLPGIPTLVGAGIGLFVAVAGVLAGWAAANRRRSDHMPQPASSGRRAD
jgi:hypothetical protein